MEIIRATQILALASLVAGNLSEVRHLQKKIPRRFFQRAGATEQENAVKRTIGGRFVFDLIAVLFRRREPLRCAWGASSDRSAVKSSQSARA
jgi:hypothetical protein